MKARIKETGEIIDVNDETFWWCKDKQESYHTSELDFLEVDTTRKFIDWEQRRYEIAKEAMNGSLSTPVEYGVYPSPTQKDIAMYSVSLADALIKELKGGREWNEL